MLVISFIHYWVPLRERNPVSKRVERGRHIRTIRARSALEHNNAAIASYILAANLVAGEAWRTKRQNDVQQSCLRRTVTDSPDARCTTEDTPALELAVLR